MATLTLRAVSLDDRPLTQPITAQFDEGGGTIGRADHNTLALPDPERHISRLQAQIVCAAGTFSICNVGSANPILVGSRPLARGEAAPLKAPGQVRIGGYRLEVVDAAPMPGSMTTPMRARDVSPALPPAAAAESLPDDFDPFKAPVARPRPPASPPPSSGAGLFDDLVPGAAMPSLDAAFGLGPGGAADPLAAFLADDTPPRRPAVAMPVADHASALHAAYAPPATIPQDTAWLRPAPPAAAAATPAPVARHDHDPPPMATRPDPRPAPPPVRAAADDDLLAAFREGAGLGSAADLPLDAERMRALGGLLRAAVAGTLQLMAARTSTKHELRAAVTVIQAQGNNPLKFSPDAAAALEQLLKPAARGFLAGPAAMDDAMRDLLGHTLGTLAGMRAALEGVLARFEPQALEARLSARSVLDSVLPMNRKARLWDLYLQHYAALREEAHEDFHALFGKAFLAAYEQQVQRVDAAGG